MSRTTVDVHEYTHTCPADPRRHVYDTRRTIVEHTPSGPCLTPVTVRVGEVQAAVPCARRLPTGEQCDSCRPVLVVRTVTRTHTGREIPPAAPVPTGLADQPCRICRQPLALVLAAHGRHILCERGWVP